MDVTCVLLVCVCDGTLTSLHFVVICLLPCVGSLERVLVRHVTCFLFLNETTLLWAGDNELSLEGGKFVLCCIVFVGKFWSF